MSINRKKNINLPFIIIMIIDILLFVAVLFLMNHVQYLLRIDVKYTLQEIVSQNKDVISNKLMMEMNNLNLSANQIAERFKQSVDPSLKNEFLLYCDEKNDSRLFIATPEGEAVFMDSATLDISGRQYFITTLEGKQNISERTVSRVDGKDIFIISVPVQLDEKIIATLHKQYTVEEMSNICKVSLFSDKGDMYIINSQGYIFVNSQLNNYNRESDNFFRMIFPQNPEQSKKIQSDIGSNISGFTEIEFNGVEYISAYTPLDSIYDWYLISSISTSAVSSNTKVVINLLYIILLGTVLFFAVLMLYFLKMKNKQQAEIKKIAFVDNVTLGCTYAKFTLDLQEILNNNDGKKRYIFVFDIDNFKYINSYYGFDIGDNILKSIYQIFHQKLNKNELFARLYNDHFVAMLEDVSDKRIDNLFTSEYRINDVAVYLSAGIYPIEDTTESISLMIDKAKIAEQKIKGMRYKRVSHYSKEFDNKVMHNEQIKRGVEQALAKKEIIPYFQPKVDINTRRLVGAEALARWKTADGKLIPPGEFISVCEETGLISLIDMTIFEQTLQFIKNKLEQNVACVPISVNFSRTHLLNDEFVDTILSKLSEYNVPPDLIEIELTETVIFDNYKTIEDFIDNLHKAGLHISMDDFGSGYSSLHMLKDIDIDVLKIDRGFLKETANSYKQKAVFAAIAQMADKLNIKVVVEGVENTDNLGLMREFGCNVAQGFYFAKPLPQNEFDVFYTNGEL